MDEQIKKEDAKDSKFDFVDLEEESDGSVADVEDENEIVVKLKTKKRKKVKRKKIYFRSDFTEDKESSTSGDEDGSNLNNTRFPIQKMNPNDLTWIMWVWYYIVCISSSTFHAAEFCGEKLADLFGITSPKYQYIINEYHRLKQEENEEEEAERRAEEYIRDKETQKVFELEGGGEETNQ